MSPGLGQSAAVLLVLAAFSMLAAFAEGAAVTVNSMRQLQRAINLARPRDVITVASGVYAQNFQLNITTNGITVRAARPGSVTLNQGIQINITGDYVTFTGFQFTSGLLSGNLISVWWGTRNVTLTQLNFDGYRVDKFINLKGRFHRVAYCNFQNKPANPRGNLVHVDPANEPNYNIIEHNYFHDLLGPGKDWGNEPIRLANEVDAAKVSRTIVQFNLFENTFRADSETISIKCAENIIRYNTFRENRKSQIVFRKTDRSVAYGNFFINSGGIRFVEANDIDVYNNYWFNASRTFEMQYTPGNLKNINVQHNTFVECGSVIQLRANATNTVWANNLFLGRGREPIFTGTATKMTFVGNQFWGSLGVTMPRGAGMQRVYPRLALNRDGWRGLTLRSPAIDAAQQDRRVPPILNIAGLNDPRLELDISGQRRRGRKDVGADEFSRLPGTYRPQLPTEVGPSYLRIRAGR